jgi:hypothetical protein
MPPTLPVISLKIVPLFLGNRTPIEFSLEKKFWSSRISDHRFFRVNSSAIEFICIEGKSSLQSNNKELLLDNRFFINLLEIKLSLKKIIWYTK